MLNEREIGKSEEKKKEPMPLLKSNSSMIFYSSVPSPMGLSLDTYSSPPAPTHMLRTYEKKLARFQEKLHHQEAYTYQKSLWEYVSSFFEEGTSTTHQKYSSSGLLDNNTNGTISSSGKVAEESSPLYAKSSRRLLTLNYIDRVYTLACGKIDSISHDRGPRGVRNTTGQYKIDPYGSWWNGKVSLFGFFYGQTCHWSAESLLPMLELHLQDTEVSSPKATIDESNEMLSSTQKYEHADSDATSFKPSSPKRTVNNDLKMTCGDTQRTDANTDHFLYAGNENFVTAGNHSPVVNSENCLELSFFDGAVQAQIRLPDSSTVIMSIVWTLFAVHYLYLLLNVLKIRSSKKKKHIANFGPRKPNCKVSFKSDSVAVGSDSFDDDDDNTDYENHVQRMQDLHDDPVVDIDHRHLAGLRSYDHEYDNASGMARFHSALPQPPSIAAISLMSSLPESGHMRHSAMQSDISDHITDEEKASGGGYPLGHIIMNDASVADNASCFDEDDDMEEIEEGSSSNGIESHGGSLLQELEELNNLRNDELGCTVANGSGGTSLSDNSSCFDEEDNDDIDQADSINSLHTSHLLQELEELNNLRSHDEEDAITNLGEPSDKDVCSSKPLHTYACFVTEVPNVVDGDKSSHLRNYKADSERRHRLDILHNTWLLTMESSGVLIASGNYEIASEYRLKTTLSNRKSNSRTRDGMMLLHASSLDHAHAIAMEDPYHKECLCTFRIMPWSMRGSVQ
mmetsp:Transcript_5196/g.5909  ORF Transcript_5196/g.5909 Transcript_5196/m.5909 type:complete len:738 (+) Transcript_5196:62-2275(+)